MPNAYSFLLRIPCEAYSISSSTFGLVGGTTTISSITSSSVVVSGGFQDFFVEEKIKFTQGIKEEYKVISSISGSTVSFTEPFTETFSITASVIPESYFGFVHNDTNIVDISEGYFFPDLITTFDDVTRAFVDNCENGGSVQASLGGSFSIVNVNKFQQFLDANSIYLPNCPVHLLLKVNTSAITYTVYNLGRYVVSGTDWNVEQFNIQFESDRLKRNAYLTTQINTTDFPNVKESMVGESIPVVFGKNYLYKQYAKFLRTNDTGEAFSLNLYRYFTYPLVYTDFSIDGSANFITFLSMETMTEVGATRAVFPCVGKSITPITVTKTFYGKFGTDCRVYLNGSSVTSGIHVCNVLINQYIHVVEGLANGQYRRISNAYFDLDTFSYLDGIITLEIESYFENGQMDGNLTATLTDNSWFEIVSVEKDYVGETWPCKSFLQSDGTPSSVVQGYSYSESKVVDFNTTGTAENIVSPVKSLEKDFNLLPNAVFSATDSTNTKIKANFQYLTNEDSIDSFVIVPFKSITLPNYDVATLYQKWQIPQPMNPMPGFYSGVNTSNIYQSYDLNPLAFSMYSTYRTDHSGSSTAYSDWVVEAQLPDLSSYQGYSAAYLYLDFEVLYSLGSGSSAVDVYGNGFQLFSRYGRFLGTASYIDHSTTSWDGISQRRFNDIITGDNQSFFTAPVVPNINGYFTYDVSNYVLSKNTRPKYEFFCVDLRMEHNKGATGGSTLIQNWSASFLNFQLVLKKSVDIEEKIYAMYSGRTYNDTWKSRKTAANLIESPLDILEHTCRLQNYSDVNPTTAIGKSYAPSAKINITNTSGGFDYTGDSNLNVVKAYTTAFSINDYEKTRSDWLKQTICRNYFLINYTDYSGKESVKALTRSAISPSMTFTLADIYDRTQLKVDESDISRIYCEPTIRYNWSPALGKFASEISITNTNKSSYSASYVRGNIVSASEKQTLWNLARALYLKTKNIETPIGDYVDLYTVGGLTGDTIAKDYLYNWLVWQFNKRITINLHLEKIITNNLDIGSRFNIVLPHHTDSVSTEVMITRIEYATEKPYICKIIGILYTSPFVDTVIQDAWTAAEDWQDVWTGTGDSEINNIL